MDLNKKLEPHFPVIEKVIFSLIFLSVLLSYLMSDTGTLFPDIIVVLEIALILLYVMQLHIKLYALIWLGFLLTIFAYFYSELLHPLVYLFFNSISYFAFGIIVLISTIKVSLKNKNLELLNFIMGFLLILQPALPLLPRMDEVITFYAFALSFSIGTIMYNDNLWHRYYDDEKNIIKYILILALVLVLRLSFKKLSM